MRNSARPPCCFQALMRMQSDELALKTVADLLSQPGMDRLDDEGAEGPRVKPPQEDGLQRTKTGMDVDWSVQSAKQQQDQRERERLEALERRRQRRPGDDLDRFAEEIIPSPKAAPPGVGDEWR